MLDAENSTEPTSSATEGPEPTQAAEAPGDTPNDAAPTDTTVETADPPAGEPGAAPAKKAAAKRTAAKKATAKKATTKKTAAKRTTQKAAAQETAEADETATAGRPDQPAGGAPAVGGPETETSDQAPVAKRAAKKTTKKAAVKRTSKKAAAPEPTAAGETAAAAVADDTTAAEEASAIGVTPVTPQGDEGTEQSAAAAASAGPPSATALLFQPPDPTKAVTRRRRTSKAAESAAESAGQGAAESAVTEQASSGEERRKPAKKAAKKAASKPAEAEPEEAVEPPSAEETAEESAEEARRTGGGEGDEDQGGERRRRRRGGRRRRRSGGGEDNADSGDESDDNGGKRSEPGGQAAQEESEESEEGAGGTRRRRRRRRSGENGEGADDSEGTVTRARKPRNAEDEITALSGSTRLEAKKQRRREGREAGRRRAPIVSEAEFLARRESVDRVMVIRQRQDLTQIAVLEDKVLVEHYVARESQTSLIGNVYLGRVQNVLPSMEAAFIDIGKGRNAVLYAGEVNWDALGAKNGQPRKIEAVLKSGQSILVQVTKDPIGHKGARLTSQISLPGRFLVYVPDGTTSGISRKLPDTERNRLKTLLKDIVPDTAGVIVRTAAEGASEDELTLDVERLTARWSDIESKVNGGNAPQLLYGEPDLTLKVVRDLFTEDFNKLVIAGDDAWDMVEGYVSHVAPDLADRLERYDGDRDVFAEYRIDEQIEKALDRKVWLPSGGSLVIDRTEAMTVVDINTGKFTGSGGNLEETVTKNNLEAAEEIVRQLRLRDIGGIIVVDFIDMVLESNRDLVLRRLVECLGRDRTRHQVAEVTSLGLVQMTRKRIGTGLLEAFSETCEHCQGRGLVLHHEPVEPKKKGEDDSRRGRRTGRGRRDEGVAATTGNGGGVPSPKDIAAIAKSDEKRDEVPEHAADGSADGEVRGQEVPTGSSPDGAVTGSDKTGTRAGEPQPGEAQPAEDQPAEGQSAESKVGGRSRGGRGRGGRGRGNRDLQTEQSAERSQEAPEPRQGEESSPTSGPETASVVRSADAGPESGPETAPAASEQPKGEEPAPAEAVTAEPSAPAEHPAPAAPKIVTSVRRRSARRPAGPPVIASGAPSTATEPAAQPTSEPAAGVDMPGSQPTNGLVKGATTEQVTDEPADADPLSSLVDAAEDDGDVDEAEVEAPSTPHVPVKKKGSRRR